MWGLTRRPVKLSCEEAEKGVDLRGVVSRLACQLFLGQQISLWISSALLSDPQATNKVRLQ